MLSVKTAAILSRPQFVNTPLCAEYYEGGKTLYLILWVSLSGEPDYFGRNKISSGGDLSHYSSASLY